SDLRPECVAEVLSRPRVREGAQVVDEGVGPDVRHLRVVPRERDPPRLAGATDGEVAETARNEAPDLVAPERGLDEVGSRVVQLEQPVLVRRQPEEVVLLLDPLWLDVVQRALPGDELVLRLERLA